MKTKTERLNLQKEFFENLSAPPSLALLFDYLPEVHLFIKNSLSQFMKVNKTNLRVLLGSDHEWEVIGKTDRDFFAPAVAEIYIEQDKRVMRTRKPVINEIQMVPNSNGILVWYLVSKVPLIDKNGDVVGIAGTLIDYEYAGSVLGPYSQFADVIKYINDNYALEITVKNLARMAHLSVSQFERNFKKLLRSTPVEYITKVRLNAACKKLSQTDTPITRIAIDTGFYDHSYFTRKFKAHLALSPKEYRSLYFNKTPRKQIPEPRRPG